MITVDLKSRIPIYEQIVDSVKSAILSGILSPNEQLPAVRKLAVELAINPNTIQKAYLILEAQEIVYSIPGRGSFVADDTSALIDSHRARVLSELKSLVEDAARCKIPKSELLKAVEEFAKE
ncbi:MAG: GntR family transcriptional regulator [Clostridia bacterium]|nr:GntR family transcriptional regulator [Clostridia bacterium]